MDRVISEVLNGELGMTAAVGEVTWVLFSGYRYFKGLLNKYAPSNSAHVVKWRRPVS